jgi:AhpD family alkylhydroperoxidase
MATSKRISRLPALPEPPADPIAAEMFDTLLSHGRKILNVHRMSLNSPKYFRAQATYAGALRRDTVLSRTLQEIVIVRAAQLQDCAYVEGVHVTMGREAGAGDRQLAAVAEWRKSPELFDEREKAALEYTELMATDGSKVDDAAFEKASRTFSPLEMMELSALVGYYIGNCRFLNAVGLMPETD